MYVEALAQSSDIAIKAVVISSIQEDQFQDFRGGTQLLVGMIDDRAAPRDQKLEHSC